MFQYNDLYFVVYFCYIGNVSKNTFWFSFNFETYRYRLWMQLREKLFKHWLKNNKKWNFEKKMQKFILINLHEIIKL